MIVKPKPSCRIILNFANGFEQVLATPTLADSAFISFHVGILLRVARLDKFNPDTLFFCLLRQLLTDKFRTVVTPQGIRRTSPLDDLLQRSGDAQGRQ